MDVLITLWRIVLSLPLVVVWVVMYLFILVGWGVAKADQFMLHWNKFVTEEDVDIVRASHETNG